MANAMTYDAAVLNTFCTNAIRSVMLIDDKFPTYDQLTNAATYTPDAFHLTKARALHKTFRSQKIICDVENNAEAIDADRVRKCDLIVLDYFLEDNNPTRSIDLLHKLTENKHLNLVVLYTSENLDEALTTIAINLFGGWKNYDDILTDPDHLTIWETIDKESILQHLDRDALLEYIFNGKISRTLSSILVSELEKIVADAGYTLQPKANPLFIDAVIHSYVNNAGIKVISSSRKTVSGSNDEVKWLLVGNAFIAFQKKQTADDHDAEEILTCLHKALIKWRPNPIRLITSEIQNVLENEPLAFDLQLEDDLRTQAGWLFNILKERDSDSINVAIEQLLRRISGNIADKILSQTSVPVFAESVFAEEKKLVLKNADVPNVAAKLIGLSRCKDNEIVHALNLDLSIEIFQGRHITTGTIFQEITSKKERHWYVCVSPACDMVPDQKNGSFAQQFDPNRPAKVLRLEVTPLDEALQNAHQSRFIFIKDEQGKTLALSAYNGVNKQPDIWMMYIHNHSNHGGERLGQFDASILIRAAASPHVPQLCIKQFIPRFQLREPYAARLQAHASHHMGRIGVDFVSWPQRDERAAPQTPQRPPQPSRVLHLPTAAATESATAESSPPHGPEPQDDTKKVAN